jgi:hypothetical protein
MKLKTKTPKDEVQTTDVAVVKKNLPALPADWQTELAADAKDEAAKEVPSAQAFSTRAGVLSYNGQAMPNNEVDVLIIGTAFVNSMFINKFDPNNIVSPLCFAMNEAGVDMVPHDNSFKKQADECVGCEQMEWGSDPNSPSGRGKMCKETRKLAVIPAEALNEEDGINKAPIVTISVPVTSVENWGGYVNLLSATAKRPVWSVITRIKLTPHPKKQFVMSFETVDAINDTDILTSLKEKRELGLKTVLAPFQMMSEEQYKDITEPKPAAKRKF